MIHSKKVGGIGESSKFEFQYLPRMGMLTELGHPGGPDEKEEAVSSSTSGTLGLMMTRHASSKTMPTRAVLLAVGAVAAVSLARLVGSSPGWLRGVPRHLLSSVMAQSRLVQSLA